MTASAVVLMQNIATTSIFSQGVFVAACCKEVLCVYVCVWEGGGDNNVLVMVFIYVSICP